ncbi:VRR-NUC domain-containing protein [Levilactobacillus wangkuiensis]|uniref:VRR-NUC domain-containing protein n=1 Tax=Levilactobacillus wangkuiensis TaxID=2799566 RepID=UPI001951DB6E|nr:VRR-NUC domain-containing protein [Levilactobacillus wangkuiensis]
MIKYPNGGVPQRRSYSPDDGKELVRPLKHKKRGPGPEHKIQDGIIEMLSLNGFKTWRINVGSVEMKDGRRFHAGPEKGFPDLCGYRKSDGKMFFIEVKTKTGKRRPAQEYFAKEVAMDPVIYGVARSPEEALMIVQQGLNRTEDKK